MTSATALTRRSPVQRQVEAYEESWRQAHQAAVACRDCEETITVGISVFRLLNEAALNWRERVIRGTEEFSAEHNQLVQTQFQLWLKVTDNLLGALSPLENQFGVVERADELRACAERARRTLATWKPPQLTRAIGLREMKLSQQEADELDRILEEGTHLPQEPSHPPMQGMSLSELRRRRQS
jgi:hypothetical protein